MRQIYSIYFLFLLSYSLHSQVKEEFIFLQNGSFEGEPACCVVPQSWVDCGHKGETPPDIQPALDADNAPLFNVTKAPQHGKTYVGLVARDNDTWERISQRLIQPIEAGKCYAFSIYMCKSENYLSASNKNPLNKYQYTKAIKLRIWGGNAHCNQKELLGESELVDNIDWKKFEFEFKPKNTLEYLELEAFYNTPVLFPYNGNLLLDNASHLMVIPCPDTKEYMVYKNKKAKDQIKEDKKAAEAAKAKTESKNNNSAVADQAKTAQTKVLKELDSKKVKVGQTIKIEKLYFDADSANIKTESYFVLDELYEFLSKNSQIKIEIGGHTNNRPSDKFADNLSTKRAKSVRDYLVSKGIEENRIKYKGYGKRSPLVSNSTAEGRSKNQRVEIKILSVN